jgi:hypothetical protein
MFLNMYSLNTRTQKELSKTNNDKRRNRCTVRVGCVNTLHPTNDTATRQKISKVKIMNSTVCSKNLVNKYRTFYPTNADYMCFQAAQKIH